jgi:predicted RNase H-like HicB family nuclease
MNLKVIIRPGEDSGFVAHVPALRGCWSQGVTRRQAIRNIKEAVTAWLEAEQDKAEREGAPGEIELVRV